MPLEAIGSYAVVGSTGAIARGARQSEGIQNSAANDSVFAASSARGGNTGGEEILISSASSGVAVYLSPFIRLDLQTRLAIVEFRDSKTGDVKQQYPSPRAVKEYQQNLPETSDLAPAPNHDEAKNLQAHVIGPGQGQSSAPLPGSTGADTGTGSGSTAPAPSGSTTGSAPAPLAHVAAAALSTAQTGPVAYGRQVAVA